MKTTDWKKELRRMKLEDIKAKSPAFFEASGSYSMKTKPYSDQTANNLTNCIIDWINFTGGYANRINVQGQARKERVEFAGGKYRDFIRFTPSTTNKGTGDIHAVVKGRHLTIEVKIGKDRLSDHQQKEQQRITRAGGFYLVATSMDQFLRLYSNLLVTL